MQGISSVVSSIVVGVIVIGAVAYGIYTTNSGLSVLSEQNTSLKGQVASLSQQVAVLQQKTVQVVTLTNTVISVQMMTSVSTATEFITNTIYSTVTTTKNIYPPSNSTYALTYVDGNATNHETSCGSFVLSVFTTYEIHQSLPSNVVVWAKFDNGITYQPSSQQVFANQAYFTVDATYSYSSGYCGVGIPASVTSWVTDSRNQVLSPFEVFVVIRK